MRLVGLAVVAALALAGEVRAEKVNWDEYIDKSPPKRVTADAAKPAATTPPPRTQVQRKRVAQPAVKKTKTTTKASVKPRARPKR